jgi:hypothetical protein
MIAIYRDGVGGPSYHEKVIRNEIKDVMSMIQSYSSNYRPQIVYTLIDEGMNIRFAQMNRDVFENPAPGTVVDQGLVEHATTQGSFDYFMIANKATVATARPVHFYVVQNKSSLTRAQI